MSYFQDQINQWDNIDAFQSKVAKMCAPKDLLSKIEKTYHLKKSKDKLLRNGLVKAFNGLVQKSSNNHDINELAEKNLRFVTAVASTNTDAVADCLILQSLQTRNNIEATIAHTKKLAHAKNPLDALALQKEFGTYTQEALREAAWMAVGLATSATESYIRLANNTYTPSNSEPTAKIARSTAPKTAVKKAPAKNPAPAKVPAPSKPPVSAKAPTSSKPPVSAKAPTSSSKTPTAAKETNPIKGPAPTKLKH